MNVHEAFAAVMKDIPAIAKAQKNVQANYSARSIDDLYDALHGVFAKHGLFCLPRLEDSELHWRQSKGGNQMAYVIVRYCFDFYSADGTGPLTLGPVQSEGMDSSDKASNKALSGAAKYALINAFLIPVSGDADPDLHHHETSAGSQPQPRPAERAASVPDTPGDGDARLPSYQWTDKGRWATNPNAVLGILELGQNEDGSWPTVCPYCCSEVEETTTSNGKPVFKCTNWKDCWAGSRRAKDSNGNPTREDSRDGWYAWSGFKDQDIWDAYGRLTTIAESLKYPVTMETAPQGPPADVPPDVWPEGEEPFDG